MPLMGTEKILAAQMFAMVSVELGIPDPTKFNPEAVAKLQKLCNGFANAIVPHIVSMTQVAPGIPTSGSPVAQVTIAPGTLM